MEDDPIPKSDFQSAIRNFKTQGGLEDGYSFDPGSLFRVRRKNICKKRRSGLRGKAVHLWRVLPARSPNEQRLDPERRGKGGPGGLSGLQLPPPPGAVLCPGYPRGASGTAP